MSQGPGCVDSKGWTDLKQYGLATKFEDTVYENPQAGPLYLSMMVDTDLSVCSFINAWELTVENVKLMPDTLIIPPHEYADWVLNLMDKFREAGYAFQVLINPAMSHDSWCLYCGSVPGYGSSGA